MSAVARFSAAEPTLDHLFPVAAQQGTSVAVRVAGKFEPWPPQAWIDAPGIAFTPTPIKGTFNVDLAPEAALGPHLVRLWNEEGASAARFFIVSRVPELRDSEPNDHYKTPQKLAELPATIGGKLGKAGDVDSFAVPRKQGQTLIARLEAYVLASTFDGLLRVVDEDGHVLAFNHDGATLDPQLVWTAPRDGTFIVQLMGFAYPASSSVQLAGGEGCVYRLHFSGEPKESAPLPLTEREPNDTAETAQKVDLPGAINARIDQARDEDRYLFTAVKDHAYEVRLTAAPDAPLDAWLKIETRDGKELARNDDATGSRDPLLIWTAPADGEHVIAVGEVTHRGGEDHIYRLALAEAAPSVLATAAAHSAVVQPGKTSELKVAVKFANGFKTKLQLVGKTLPAGVIAEPVEVPEKGGDVTLKLAAQPDAPAAGQPLQVVLRESEGGREHPVLFRLNTIGEDNGVPQGFATLVVESTDQLWLTVAPAPSK